MVYCEYEYLQLFSVDFPSPACIPNSSPNTRWHQNISSDETVRQVSLQSWFRTQKKTLINWQESVCCEYENLQPSGVEFPSPACIPNSSFEMASIHFWLPLLRRGCTTSGLTQLVQNSTEHSWLTRKIRFYTVCCEYKNLQLSGVDFPSPACIPNSSLEMASKHFLRWGCTARGFLVWAKISRSSSLDKK